LSGEKAIAKVKQFFSGTIDDSSGGHFYFGKIYDEDGSVLDEVIVLIYINPHSYTGENVVEISCHSNPYILKDILDLFLRNGCRLADPGEFTKRAFINGKIDLIQAEAVADLIMSQSRSGVRNSLLQMEGKLSEKLKLIKQQLIDVASLLELDLDFSEEDLEIIDASQITTRIQKINNGIVQLLESYRYGHILTKGIEVLIAGKPNVGKSCLMNTLLNKDRVIVSETPGTTRDMIHEDIIVDNINIRFVDSAGIRITDNKIEAEGVDRARKHMDHADIILLLVDIASQLTEEDEEILDKINEVYPLKTVIVGNKMDLGINNTNTEYLDKHKVPYRYVSALKGDGVNELKKEIVKKVHDMENQSREEIMISNERQFNILTHTKEAIEKTIPALDENIGFEFVAIDIKTAINLLSEITGEITTDDILNNIFSQFCIGK